jgi:hypothetical protein
VLSAKYWLQNQQRNWYLFYIPIMNWLRKRPGKQSHSQQPQKKGAGGTPGIILAKKVKVIYNKNYKTLKKEIEEDSKRGKTCHVYGSAEL